MTYGTGLSMSPLILPTDKPFIRKSKSYKVNDIVAFRKDGRIIAHRIIYRFPNGTFVTKGDNNLKSDGIILKRDILGKVEKVLRNAQTVFLSHVYLSQSSTYLNELNLLNKSFKKTSTSYVLLKGLPIHLAHSGKIPKRLYFDADILVKRSSLSRVLRIFEKLDYQAVEPVLLGKKVRSYSQISFIKKVRPYAVAIDVHFSPAIGFTKALGFNKLIPSTTAYTNNLFKNAKELGVGNNLFPMLIKEDLLLYLLLHLFHHNFQGIHRMELIRDMVRKDKPDMNKVLIKAKKYGYGHFIYPSILTFNNYFGGIDLPEETRNLLSVRLAGFFVAQLSPFDADSKIVEAGKKLFFCLLLSPVPLMKKLSVVLSKDALGYFFSTIRSTFLRS